MDKTCCMIGCGNTNSSVPAVQLFPFPVDLDLCKRWVENSEDPQLLEDFTHNGIESVLNKYVCVRHFQTLDFIDPELKRLKLNAVPFTGRCFIKTESDEYTQVRCDFIKCEVIDGDYVTSAYGDNSIGCVVKKELEDFSDELGRKGSSIIDSTFKETCESNLDLTVNRCKNEAKRDLKIHERPFLRKRIETDEERALRRQKCALRTALRRSKETAEQREARLLKDKVRAAEKRRKEDDLQSAIRKSKNALNNRLRINLENEEERALRRQKDAVRAALRRSSETPEQREARLLKGRVQAAERRRRKGELKSKNLTCNVKAESIFNEVNN